jgi:hypothetical protein
MHGCVSLEERRKSQRHHSLKGGRIVFHDGHSTLSCVIRNLSDKGAKLQIANVLGVPAEFSLRFDDGSPPRQCAVIWEKGSTLGVEFK